MEHDLSPVSSSANHTTEKADGAHNAQHRNPMLRNDNYNKYRTDFL